MTNPYEPPKTMQKPAPLVQDFFIRMQKYQFRAFYAGLLLCIASALLSGMRGYPVLADAFDILGAVGAVMLFLSLGSILPLSVWGFVKGYRESR